MRSQSRPIPPAVAAIAVGLVAFATGTPSHGAAPARPVDVYPIGGTSTANPATQISFRGATKLKALSVTGSTTGPHSGHFARHGDGHGVSFIPDRRFRTGELVTVRSATRLVRSDANGAVRFRILTPPRAEDMWRFGRGHAGDPGGDPPGTQSFRSRPDLRPPGLDVTANLPGASRDEIFLAVKAGPGQDGPMIRDYRGRLLWFRRVLPPLSPYNFRAQTYLGRRVLTWWQGKVVGGKGRGEGMILDDGYRLVKRVRAGNGFAMDQHEFLLTPQGTALFTVYQPVRYSLEAAGGPRDGNVWDSIVQEVDLKTGLVLFEWHSLAHVSVRLGAFPVRGHLAYDPFHANSIAVDGRDRLLLSARNTNALFEIDRHSGRVLWRLGGRRSSFPVGRGTATIGQHQAVRQRDGTISVFDNGGSTRFPSAPDKEARGAILSVDPVARRVSLVHEYKHPGVPVFTRSQGSMQMLTGGDVFLSWGGSRPYLSELTRDGKPVFEASILPKEDDTYRAYRLPWRGAHPPGTPDVSASSGSSGTDVYVSWNGATDVSTWEVLAGADPRALLPAGAAGWSDFETKITLPGLAPRYVAVRALDSRGGVLGTSAVVAPKRGGRAAVLQKRTR